jgi:hypothetical protein
MFLAVSQRVMNDPLKLLDESIKHVGHDGHHKGWVVQTNLEKVLYGLTRVR